MSYSAAEVVPKSRCHTLAAAVVVVVDTFCYTRAISLSAGVFLHHKKRLQRLQRNPTV